MSFNRIEMLLNVGLVVADFFYFFAVLGISLSDFHSAKSGLIRVLFNGIKNVFQQKHFSRLEIFAQTKICKQSMMICYFDLVADLHMSSQSFRDDGESIFIVMYFFSFSLLRIPKVCFEY